MKKLLAAFVLSAGVVSSVQAQTLTFEGIPEFAAVGSYYNGVGGPNYGISFFTNALVGNSALVPCTGTLPVAGQPSGCAVIFFADYPPSGLPNTGMNRIAGFQSAISLFYTSPAGSGTLSAYSGLNGTGTLLGSTSLPATAANGAGFCNSAYFCPFSPASVPFAGVAQSVVFAGPIDFIAFDDITFTAAAVIPSVVPEPASYVLMGFGLSLVGIAARRRRKA